MSNDINISLIEWFTVLKYSLYLLYLLTVSNVNLAAAVLKFIQMHAQKTFVETLKPKKLIRKLIYIQ